MSLSIPVRWWHVSENGTDSSDCGEDVINACASFHSLWGRIVDDENKATYNVIYTYGDLVIDGMYLHSPDKWLIFLNRTSRMINITITNTTIENTHLRFGFDFEESSISLRIENCYISSSSIDIIRLSQPAVINNCTFHGDTRTDNITSPEVMSGNRLENEYPLIYCWSSNITMRNVVVRDNVRRGMGFYFCNVQIKDSRFTSNNFTEGRISSGGITLFWSNARVINSTFTGNQGHTLVVMRQSYATTVGCQFLDNTVKGKGAAVNVSDQSEYHDQGSSFADNVAGEGGKILNKKKKHSLKLFKMGNCCSIYHNH